MHINDFDIYMKHMRSRKPESPPPLIDVSNRYAVSDNEDGQHVIEQISSNPNIELPNLTADEDIGIDNIANKGDMVVDTNDESVIDVQNDINGNTNDNVI